MTRQKKKIVARLDIGLGTMLILGGIVLAFNGHFELAPLVGGSMAIFSGVLLSRHI